MRDSVIKSAIRSFFIAFFAIIGVFIACLIIVLFFSTASETVKEPERSYKVEILPNAKGERKILSSSAPVILQINLDGVIGTELLNMNTIRQQLIESREGDLKNNRVKGILLHINSPGGTVNDSDAIYRLLRQYREQFDVPIYAFVDGLCASGALYTAVGANKIFATDVSLIGSVGVVSGPFLNLYQLLEKVGVEPLMISAGKGKTNLNPFRKWESGEQDNLVEIIHKFYDFFVSIVASERPELTKEKLVEDYGAKIFTAQQAKNIGYIDGSGDTYRSVLKGLLKEVGIEDNFYQVVQLQTKKWYVELFRSENPIWKGAIKHQINFCGYDVDSKLLNQYLYLYTPNK